MKAILRPVYGKADVLRLGDIEKPAPVDNQLLVKVRAASINPFDWHMMRGTPYLVKMVAGFPKPKSHQLGGDFAGTVEAIGPRVTRFKPGDDVFGVSHASYAEYLTVAEPKNVAFKPPALTFEQAAALPIAGLTALQALRDRGRVRPGQRVLINGASGGVGAFAVQIARSLGAEVAAVCSTPNVDLVRSLGASRVFDYKKEDFAAGGQQYDVVLDNVGNRPLSGYRRVLKPRGIFVGNGGGGPDDMIWGFGFVGGMIRSLVLSLLGSRKFIGVFANVNEKDLTELAHLVESGTITPVIERRYPLAETPDAIRHVESMRARGKVIIVL
jgi:NADPH:quinone reductase-like Zn-dependent oxidoreductase